MWLSLGSPTFLYFSSEITEADMKILMVAQPVLVAARGAIRRIEGVRSGLFLCYVGIGDFNRVQASACCAL